MGEAESKMVNPDEALKGRAEAIVIDKPHYILNNPMMPPFPEDMERVIFGTGCFWGTERIYYKRVPGVYTTAVGYAAGYTQNPTYREVCTGQTGHNEVVQIVYDPKTVSFVDLLKTFWESHDPTQGMGQGGDRGTQYRSGIYCTSEEQKTLAEASRKAYQHALNEARHEGAITTEILDAPTFYYAEDYHQQYLDKPGNRQYCGAQPTGVALPKPDSWDLPDDLKAKATKINEDVWGMLWNHCVF